MTKPGFLRQIRAAQFIFRLRLHWIRTRQLAEAERRAAEAGECWQAWLREASRQRNAYWDLACHLCGGRAGRRCCQRALKDPKKLLRRMAGLHESEGVGRWGSAGEWSEGYRSRPGPRSCGPSSWDNAVRAIEEDR